MLSNTLCCGTFAAALLVGSVEAFWRLPCQGQAGVARIDPLINPGVASDHAHVVHGGGNFGMSSSYSDLMASSCTSCEVKEDKSAYWTPNLYFQGADGKTEMVKEVGGLLAYYLLYGNKPQAFPAGFKMIAGDTRLRNFSWPVPDPPKSDWSGDQLSQLALSQKALGFNCLDYSKPPEGSMYRHFLPDKAYLDANCKDGVRFELMFPSCWNGQDTPPDFKSHMAYPNLVNDGVCPDGFPKRLISLFYETIWDTYAFNGRDGKFVISNGDPTGYGYHGDFIAGWDVDFLQKAADTCTNDSGLVSDCPLFTLQSQDQQGQCKFAVPDLLKNDDCVGPRNGLPGDVPIQYGPAYASPLGGSAVAPAKTNPPPDSLVVPSQGYASATTSLIAHAQLASATITPAPVPEASQQAVVCASTITSTQGHEVYEICVVDEEVTVTADYTTTIEAYKKRAESYLKRHINMRGGHARR